MICTSSYKAWNQIYIKHIQYQEIEGKTQTTKENATQRSHQKNILENMV